MTDCLLFDDAVLGSQLWTGSDDHTIRVWVTQFGECLATLEGHTGSVLSMVACQTEPAGVSTPVRHW
jgi:WD40 repeat protein